MKNSKFIDAGGFHGERLVEPACTVEMGMAL